MRTPSIVGTRSRTLRWRTRSPPLEQTGGKVLEIRYVNEQGERLFNAVIAKHDTLLNMQIDENDKVVAMKLETLPSWMVDWRLRADMEAIRRVKVPMPKAVAQAEKMFQGRAIDAALAKPWHPTQALKPMTSRS